MQSGFGIWVKSDLVRFRLYAPHKKRVAVVGSFNGWSDQSDVLEETGEGVWELERALEEGGYSYQYVVDGITICDPWARAVVWPHPPVRQRQPKGFFTVGEPPYLWRNTDWQRPAFKDLVLCELHVLDFSPQGTFRGVTERLDYLKSVGITAIELMPVCEAVYDEEWGYQPTCLFACRSAYGRAHDLKELIDEAHGRGMAVILDVIVTHTAPSHPFMLLYPMERSPWYSRTIHNEFHMPGLDHRKRATQDLVHQFQRYWLEEFHVDGLRYDYSKSLVAQGRAVLNRVLQHAREVTPGCYLILEHLPEEPLVTRGFDADAVWHARTSYGVKALLTQRTQGEYDGEDFEQCLSVFDHRASEYRRASQMVNYLESHDEQRFGLELRFAGHKVDGLRRRLVMAAIMLMTFPGVPMLYHGQEFGETSCINYNERNPLRWELLATRAGNELLNVYRKLCALRHEHPALRSETYRFEPDPEQRCVVVHRWDHDDDVVIAVNVSEQRRDVAVVFPKRGTWGEALAGRNVVTASSSGESVTVTLEPFDALIFVSDITPVVSGPETL